MTIALTTTFNLDIGDLMEEAYERAGLKLETGYDYRTGKRSIDLILLEWQNRNIDIWMVEEVYWDSNNGDGGGTFTVGVGDIDFTLQPGTVEVLDVIVRTGATGTPYTTAWVDNRLTRLTERDYATIVDKQTTGTPSSYYMKTHEIANATGGSDLLATTKEAVISLYPAFDATAYNLLYWRTRRIADVGNPASRTIEIPVQYLPALVAGLAFKICMKHGEVGGRLPALKAAYDEQIGFLGKKAAPNDKLAQIAPVQQQPAPQQYPMVRGRDGSMRISRTSGSRRM